MGREKFNQEGNVVFIPSDTADPTDVAKIKIPNQVCCRETAVMR